MLRSIAIVALALCHGITAFAPSPGLYPPTEVKVSAENSRRTFMANAIITAAAALLVPTQTFALNNIPADNEIVKEQRTVVKKLDINNAPVADYMKLPGMYPKIGGKIANNGPYKTVNDVYKLNILDAKDKALIKKYESVLTATPFSGLDTMRGRDPYRSSFNKMAVIRSD